MTTCLLALTATWQSINRKKCLSCRFPLLRSLKIGGIAGLAPAAGCDVADLQNAMLRCLVEPSCLKELSLVVTQDGSARVLQHLPLLSHLTSLEIAQSPLLSIASLSNHGCTHANEAPGCRAAGSSSRTPPQQVIAGATFSNALEASAGAMAGRLETTLAVNPSPDPKTSDSGSGPSDMDIDSPEAAPIGTAVSGGALPTYDGGAAAAATGVKFLDGPEAAPSTTGTAAAAGAFPTYDGGAASGTGVKLLEFPDGMGELHELQQAVFTNAVPDYSKLKDVASLTDLELRFGSGAHPERLEDHVS